MSEMPGTCCWLCAVKDEVHVHVSFNAKNLPDLRLKLCIAVGPGLSYNVMLLHQTRRSQHHPQMQSSQPAAEVMINSRAQSVKNCLLGWSLRPKVDTQSSWQATMLPHHECDAPKAMHSPDCRFISFFRRNAQAKSGL